MKLGIVLVHNKSTQENFDQIEAFKPLISRITTTHDELDEAGNKIGTFDTYHYEIKGLDIPHEARFFQIIPFGVAPPSNLYDIDSHKVFYGKGDEDKTGNHPRFFNWGLKRSTDYGADVVIHLEDYTKLSIEDLVFQLNTLIDPTDRTEYIEDPSIKVTTVRLLKKVGLLDERKTIEDAIADLKDRNVVRGGMNG